jgi:hypothetical protein
LFFDASITVWHYPQHNGNIAEMKGKRADWFYFYFYNLCIFYLKYDRKWNMPFVFAYCIVLSFKHALKYSLGLKEYKKMVSGYFHGAKRGITIGKLSNGNKYYSPTRLPKEHYETITSL